MIERHHLKRAPMRAEREQRPHPPWQACDCEDCRSMCTHTPCWPSPREAERLIRQGYAGALMLSEGDAAGGFAVVSPAIIGHGGRKAPAVPEGTCVFFTAERRCALHDLGLKPIEGRLAACPGASRPAPADLHHRIAVLWKTKRGRRTIELWKRVAEAETARLSARAGTRHLTWARSLAAWLASALIGSAIAVPAAAQTYYHPRSENSGQSSSSPRSSDNGYPVEHGYTNGNKYPIEHGDTRGNKYPIEHGDTNGNKYPIEHGDTNGNKYPIEHGYSQ